MVHEALEWLGRGEVAEIEEDLVPKPRVKQVQHGVLGATDVEIHTAGLRVFAHPIIIRWLADEAF